MACLLTPDDHRQNWRTASACEVDVPGFSLDQPSGLLRVPSGATPNAPPSFTISSALAMALSIGFPALDEDGIGETLHQPSSELALPLVGSKDSLATRHHRKHHRKIEHVHVIGSHDQGTRLRDMLAPLHIQAGHEPKERVHEPVTKTVVDGQVGSVRSLSAIPPSGVGVVRRRPSTVTRVAAYRPADGSELDRERRICPREG